MPKELQPQWIDSASGVAELAQTCRAAGLFALDTEADSLHSYFHKVCLIQVTVRGMHAVIDPLVLEKDDLKPLFDACGDRNSRVLMHGADYDIRVLDRDYDASIGGLMDTQIMAQVLGEEKTGLASLLQTELEVTLDKKHQRADWGRRPLRSSMLAYAAADTAYLEQLVGRLRRRLEELGRWAWAEEDAARLEEVRHVAVEPDVFAFEKVKGVSGLKGRARDIAFSLFRWRDQEARRRDTPPFKVLGNGPLLTIASDPPSSRQELAAVVGIGPQFVGRQGPRILDMINQPSSSPDRRRLPRRPVIDPRVKKTTKRLLEKRDLVAGELGISPGFLCPRAVIAAIAGEAGPAPVLKDLEGCGLTGWRFKVLAERLNAALISDE